MITIVDYGLGNVLAFRNVYKQFNIPIAVARTVADLTAASKIILPGVGAFDHAMDLLQRSGMRDTLDALVMTERIPVLGICVGMQILAHASEEGRLPGLGWIDGTVKKFYPASLPQKMPLPHMGWNDARPVRENGLFRQLEHEARFYFLHSYYFCCAHDADTIAVSEYGGSFSSAINSKNIYGVQFHPEKSHHYGTQLLKNFADL